MVITTFMMCTEKNMPSKNQIGTTYVLCFCDINGFSVLCLNGTVYTHGSVTGQPESLSHPGEANCQAPPKIVPPWTKDFPLVSSDYTKRLEPEPLRDTFYGHERTYTLER
ncbi:unnamed protein product, partial [Brassica rapa subsp. trilocularis]